jgi:hypothetical protein
MTNAGKNAVSANEITLTPADYGRLVPVAYSNTFGAYHPPTTNQTAAVVTPLPPVKKTPHPTQQRESPYAHGAPRMVYSEHSHNIIAAAPAHPVPPIEIKQPAAVAPVSVSQSDVDSMEQQLLQNIVVTSDDFRQLMQDRASQVEGYILKSGKVTADRLFITAPKPIQPNSTGEDRVNLTLD